MNKKTETVSKMLAEGLDHHQAGCLGGAEKAYERALKTDPKNPDALHLLGLAALQGGRAERARQLIEKAVLERPGDSSFLYNLGEAHRSLGDGPRAIDCYQQALNIDPGDTDTLANLANVLVQNGRFEEAEVRLRQSLEASPGEPDILNNLGLVLRQLDRPEDACDCFHMALKSAPNHPIALNNLGNVLESLGRADEAEGYYDRALAADPAFVEARYNLGKLFLSQGHRDLAKACFRQVLDTEPGHVRTHMGLGKLFLSQGQFRDAWEHYEWRWKEPDSQPRPLAQPWWRGEELKDKTVVVWGEQGVGDVVQFAGLVPDLVDRGAKVVLESDPRLVPLFQRSFAGVECVAASDPPAASTINPSVDFQTPIGGLGQWLRHSFEDFPDRKSYLVADTGKTAALRARYRQDGDDLLVGISWRSVHPEFGSLKSMTLGDWQPIVEIPGVRFINLQYGDTADERETFCTDTGYALVHDQEIDSLLDLDTFAAQVAAMDLVISVSNTTVHLAGALGVPTWVLLPDVPELLIRWMIEREDSPWYPSVRLLRQTTRRDWRDVVEKTAAELRLFAGNTG
ncbi:MAG: tetratricopeptide repeat protein [Proteobacteria bacterium]|nr:tetratricopeptide repeat protein [Pseudomonadota bacterium]